MLLLLAIVLFATVNGSLSAAPKAEAWPRWEANDPASAVGVDHGVWADFLGRYVIAAPDGGVGLLAYGTVTGEDRAALDGYISGLERVPVSGLNRSEQLAYWINLYNAATVRVVLDHYPTASIRDIKLGGSFSSGPWSAKILTVEGEKVSLDDIEHRILRPLWRDPRIHYAVNCASLGCPNLQPEPFTADNADRLLDRGAREYVNDPRGVSIADGRLTLSSIYTWFADDFGPDRESLFEHLGNYADPDLSAALARYSGRINYAYDWSLNDAPERSR